MSALRRTAAIVGVVCALTLVAAGDAPERDASPQATSSQVAALEALVAEQQQRLAELEQLVASVSAQETDAARVAAMKQQIREVLSEREFRESLLPSTLQAGYDNGFFIKSSDEKFLLKINGRMQFRWTHYARQSRNHYLQPRLQRDDITGFDIRRLRLVFSGYAYEPDLTYLVELMADSPTVYDIMPLYAWVNYRFMDEFQFRAGMMQLAGTRATFNSSANMQFPEYFSLDAAFSTWTGVGVRFWGQLFEKRFEYYLDVVNSIFGANNRPVTPDPAEMDSNPGIALRLVWHALGDNPTKDFVDWGDLDFHETPALDLGFHYVFNDDRGDLNTQRLVYGIPGSWPGGFGVTSSNGVQVNQFGVDAALKWQGFSVTGEYVLQLLDPRHAGRRPFTPLWLLTREGSTTANHGAYVQTGYFLPIPGLEKKIEAVARVGGMATNAGETEGTWTYGGGVNYYIQGNKVKLQADVEKIYETPIAGWGLGNVNDNALIFRVQLQVAF